MLKRKETEQSIVCSQASLRVGSQVDERSQVDELTTKVNPCTLSLCNFPCVCARLCWNKESTTHFFHNGE